MGWLFSKPESREVYRPVEKLWLFIHPCYNEFYQGVEPEVVAEMHKKRSYPQVKNYYTQIIKGLGKRDALCIISYDLNNCQDYPWRKNVRAFILGLREIKPRQTIMLSDISFKLHTGSPNIKIINAMLRQNLRMEVSEQTKIYATGEHANNCLPKYSLSITYSGKEILDKKKPVLFIPYTTPDEIIGNNEFLALGLHDEVTKYRQGFYSQTIAQVTDELVNRELHSYTREERGQRKHKRRSYF